MKVTLIYAYWPNQPGGVTWCDLPWALRDRGLPKKLHEAGHEVIETILMAEEPAPEDLIAGLHLASEISEAVAEAEARREFAVVIAGSCALVAVGAIGGLGADTAIAWFDAHPDLNTPETSTSGLFEGMALAAVAGNAWQAMIRAHSRVKAPIDLRQVTLFGTRSVDTCEQSVIDANKIVVTTDPTMLSARLTGASRVYAHLDMDVHAALNVRAHSTAIEGGPSVASVRAGLTSIPNLACLGITGLDRLAPDASKAADIAIDHVLATVGGQSAG